MTILVVGALRHVHPLEEAEPPRFAAACREMGHAFAEKGHTLIVGTNDPEDSDYNVLEDANEVNGAHVIVCRPDTDQRDVPHASAGKKVQNVAFRRGEWTSVQLDALSEAAVLVLVGDRKTAVADRHSAAAVRPPISTVPWQDEGTLQMPGARDRQRSS